VAGRAAQGRGEPIRRDDPGHHDAEDGWPRGAARVKETHPDIDVIMVTGLSQIETAVRCMKLGAFDYLPKPFDPDELKLVWNVRWRGAACCRRTSTSEARSAPSTVSRTLRVQSRDAKRLSPDRPMRSDQQHRPDHRRERDGQGTDRTRYPLQQPAEGQTVRRGRLQLADRNAAGKRVVRACQGVVHRRGGQ